MNLVIVESPTKAKTIQKFLPKEYTVLSSYGHVRDLPKSQMGVDVAADFQPRYVIPRKAQKNVTALKKAAKKATSVILATDEDREGEAIAWHLVKALDLGNEESATAEAGSRLGGRIKNKDVQRIVFHEITKGAIEEALEHPRKIDEKLVDAQQARRILDRLVGYELSPLLWKKVARGLSAGRVQSVALRLIADREREIKAFISQEYWTVSAQFAANTQPSDVFEAALVEFETKKLGKFDIPNEARAKEVVGRLEGGHYSVERVEAKATTKSPHPPFTTSTLQQEANRRLGFSAQQTMRVAQDLYEVGLITYMRTDSFNLAEKFLGETQTFLASTFGAAYATGTRGYKTRSRGAQEAHEAVRPTEVMRTPESAGGEISDARALRLYTLIWQRAVASQMPEARLDATTVRIATASGAFQTTGSQLVFDGFLKVYPMEVKTLLLPKLTEGEALSGSSITPTQHFTEPPARYSDASLVKALEEHGIGRPSTYAPTIATIVARRYTERIENRRLKPTDMGMLVSDLLEKHFPSIVDLEFTARMEHDLDEIADGNKPWVPLIAEFYGPFHALIAEKEQELSKKELTEEKTDEVCEKCGKPMLIKMGRFGKFIACSGFPACRNTKRIEVPGGALGESTGDTKIPCHLCGKGTIISRRSKRGRIFYGCSAYPACTAVLWNKPAVDESGALKKCDLCQSPMVVGAKEVIKCSNKECINAGPQRRKKEAVPAAEVAAS